MTLVLQEARVGEDAFAQVVKSVVEELALERVDLSLTGKVLLKQDHFEKFWLVDLEGITRWHPRDDGREMGIGLHLCQEFVELVGKQSHVWRV